MVSVDLSTCACGGPVIVALRGELDVVNAARVAAALSAVAARAHAIVVDLAGLDGEDIDQAGEGKNPQHLPLRPG